ncbi:MAG: Fe-S oxidoreductase, partial [Crocinitomicaceae bacterium]
MLKVRQNILLGRDVKRSDNTSERWRTMLLVAFGQKKMFSRPIAALLHLALYVAFVITQIELVEIIADGITGNHRMFMGSLGDF